MLAKLKTFSLLGIEALPVDVEVDVTVRRSELRFWEFYCAPDLEFDTIKILKMLLL